MHELPWRLAQLDVARQKESVDFIRRHMEFLAQQGYNGLFVYLEDRVRTASYELSDAEEQYSCEDIRDLVGYGKSLGLELIPCVPMLGHGERFLRHAELSPLAELREGGIGLFGGKVKSDFCPRSEAFYDFMLRYVAEVAELFPCGLFHAGGDEIWDVGICPSCRAVAANHEGRKRLLTHHFLRIHQHLKGLGKRMMLWTDMLENYPGMLEELPRDIILVDWQYQDVVRCGQAHFGNLRQMDLLTRYGDLGFQVMIAPNSQCLTNVRSYLELCDGQEQVIGCLLTHWDKSQTCHMRFYPVIACAGAMMRGASEDQAFGQMMESFWGAEREQIFDQAIRYCCESGVNRTVVALPDSVLHETAFPPNGPMTRLADEGFAAVMRSHAPSATTERGAAVLRDLLAGLRLRICVQKLNDLMGRGFHGGMNDALREEFAQVGKSYDGCLHECLELWRQARPEQSSKPMEKYVEGNVQRLSEEFGLLEKLAFLNVRIVLPDSHGYDRVCISGTDDRGEFVMADKVLKPQNERDAMFEYRVPLVRMPKIVTLSVNGFGGVGIAWLEVRYLGRVICRPQILKATGGQVEHPEHLLYDDSTWCFFGEQMIQPSFEQPESSRKRHWVSIRLGRS